MTTATERFKMLLANALERVCVLEAELEACQRQLADLLDERARDSETSVDGELR